MAENTCNIYVFNINCKNVQQNNVVDREERVKFQNTMVKWPQNSRYIKTHINLQTDFKMKCGRKSYLQDFTEKSHRIIAR